MQTNVFNLLSLRKLLLGILLCFILAFPTLSQAELNVLRYIAESSYHDLLKKYALNQWILVLWSIDCQACLKELAILSELHTEHPEIKIVLVTNNPAIGQEQIQLVLEQYQLDDIENLQFPSKDRALIMHSIDPTWRGEIPRTYAHLPLKPRIAKTGLLEKEAILNLLRAYKP